MRAIGAFAFANLCALDSTFGVLDTYYRKERKAPAKERRGVLTEFRKSHQYQMRNLLPLLLLSVIVVPTTTAFSQGTAATPARIETSYDSVKDKTTVRLLPVKISGERDRYYSLHMAPSFSYSGHQQQPPSFIDFELRTVVKGRLRTDLYVVFIVDGETIFLSSSRSAVKNPVPGRLWVGEQLIFRMPYETLLKITKAKKVEIKMDAVRFAVDEVQLRALQELVKRAVP